MEFNYSIKKPDLISNLEKVALNQSDRCELQVKLDLNDVLVLLQEDKEFSKISKLMSPICYRMSLNESNELIVTIEGVVA
jgi:hypothetical protein